MVQVISKRWRKKGKIGLHVQIRTRDGKPCRTKNFTVHDISLDDFYTYLLSCTKSLCDKDVVVLETVDE